MQFMHMLNLCTGSISFVHCASRLHQLQRPLAMKGGFTFNNKEDEEWFWASVKRLLDQQEGYPSAPTDPAEPAETEAARNQREEKEEFSLQSEGIREEQERNLMLANDGEYLAHLVQGLRQPSPWCLMAMRGDGFLEALD